jgi:hypothetical protein
MPAHHPTRTSDFLLLPPPARSISMTHRELVGVRLHFLCHSGAASTWHYISVMCDTFKLQEQKGRTTDGGGGRRRWRLESNLSGEVAHPHHETTDFLHAAFQNPSVVDYAKLHLQYFLPTTVVSTPLLSLLESLERS